MSPSLVLSVTFTLAVVTHVLHPYGNIKSLLFLLLFPIFVLRVNMRRLHSTIVSFIH
ncbi:uncharacterized protein LY89DRAFT_681011 [Mollisia scopiformis]|uniref:Uncharacterized protein n=1 Tax=Mollisia scopiformis TaxID=149040 RepID=A0A194XN23_MOLSC|nr:uncharacterized protein LY89DRAFT_681011 [Mollisia scopiformis]KUJ21526.1 hypothetical protein LY89DRAFT_681011 [Mollisia scopiformis]